MITLPFFFNDQYNWNQTLPQAVRNNIVNAYFDNLTANGISLHYYNSSNTVNAVLTNTDRGYYSTINPYVYLAHLCSLTINSKHSIDTRIYRINPPDFSSILELRRAYTHTPPTNENRITILYAPRNKRILTELLTQDETLDALRIKNIELLCVQRQSHFIRIYKGFNEANPDDYTVFTDILNPRLVNTLYLMLPNLLNIQVLPTQSEETQKTITYVRDIFKFIYENFDITADSTADTDERTEDYYTLWDRFKELNNLLIQHLHLNYIEISTFLNNLCNNSLIQQKQRVERTIQQLTRNIADSEERLINAYHELQDNKHMYEGLQTIKNQDITAYNELLQNNKQITILESNNTNSLVLSITAPLQYFISEDFETYENKTDSVYNERYKFKPRYKTLLHEIFVTRKYSVLVTNTIRIRAQNDINITAISSNNNRVLHNPHLEYYDCWSKAKTEMHKHLTNQEFDLFLMQMIAAVQTVNIMEMPTFVDHFLNEFKRIDVLNTPCIQDNTTQQIYTIAEALDRVAPITTETTGPTPTDPIAVAIPDIANNIAQDLVQTDPIFHDTVYTTGTNTTEVHVTAQTATDINF